MALATALLGTSMSFTSVLYCMTWCIRRCFSSRQDALSTALLGTSMSFTSVLSCMTWCIRRCFSSRQDDVGLGGRRQTCKAGSRGGGKGLGGRKGPGQVGLLGFIYIDCSQSLCLRARGVRAAGTEGSHRNICQRFVFARTWFCFVGAVSFLSFLISFLAVVFLFVCFA